MIFIFLYNFRLSRFIFSFRLLFRLFIQLVDVATHGCNGAVREPTGTELAELGAEMVEGGEQAVEVVDGRALPGRRDLELVDAASHEQVRDRHDVQRVYVTLVTERQTRTNHRIWDLQVQKYNDNMDMVCK